MKTSDEAVARELHALTARFCEAYAQRDAIALRTLVWPPSLDAPEGLRGFVNQCLARGQVLRPVDGGGLSADGLRAAASLTVGPPDDGGEARVTRARAVRLLWTRDIDGTWKALGATTEVALAAAFLAGLWDGLARWAELPASPTLIRRGQRLADALTDACARGAPDRRALADALADAVGDERLEARMSLTMLAGQAQPGLRVTVLPCRVHPVANRGAIGLGLEAPSGLTSEFWLLCRSDARPDSPPSGGDAGGGFALLGTTAHMSMGLLLGTAGGEAAQPRRGTWQDAEVASAGPGQPPSRDRVAGPGGARSGGAADPFEQAIARAVATPPSAAEAAEGDAFDRAIRARMATDDDARARLTGLFSLLADDRRDATLRAVLSGWSAADGEGAPGPDGAARPGVDRPDDGASALAPLEALFRDGGLLAKVRAEVGTYVAPLVGAGETLNVDADFLATHGEALVGAVLKAVMAPLSEALGPESLLGDGSL